MTLRYYIVPFDIECVDCQGVIHRSLTDATLDESTKTIEFEGTCQGCGKAGIVSLPILDARPLPTIAPETPG